MDSFAVPFTDDQIEVDHDRQTVSLFRDAWNRQSCGDPDQRWTFAQLRQDPAVFATLLKTLAPSDGEALERCVQS